MSVYIPKDWALADPITPTDLQRMENGIAAVFGTLATSVDFASIAEVSVAVTADVDAYHQPGTPIVLFSVTPTVNSRLILTGYVTLKFGGDLGTPDLSWAVVQDTGALLLPGSIGNRSRASKNQPVCLPVGGAIELNAYETTTMHLAMSSSLAGTVSIWGSGRTHITGVLLPR